MLYLGGKVRLSRYLVPAILNNTAHRGIYWEPFLGGAAVLSRIAPYFSSTNGSDIQPDLILMFQALQAGWEPPASISEQEYQALKHSEPSALRGFAGFGCSYGGRFFAGYARAPGLSRNFCSGARSVLTRDIQAMKGTTLRCLSYECGEPPSGTVIYCDPPYKGVMGFSGMPRLNQEQFWATAQQWAESGSDVFVSSYEAPGGWCPIWTGNRTIQIGGNNDKPRAPTTEHLYAWRP